MANAHPVPPPPRSNRLEHLNFNGAGQSLVDVYNLGNTITDMRRRGKSYRDITARINDGQHIPNGYKISHNTIARWCRDHGLGGDAEEDVADLAVNVYYENVKSLRDVNLALDSITVLLDEMNKKIAKKNFNITNFPVDNFSKLVAKLDVLTLRRQVLTAAIRDMQDKVYKYETISRAIQLIMEIVGKYLSAEEYQMLVGELRENKILCELLKRITPSNL